MKLINSRKVAMAFGGILVATLAAGCSGGSRGYSNNSYGYNSSYSSFGDSYPYSGYSYPQSYGNSYNAGYQNGLRADENRDHYQSRDTDLHDVVIRDRSEARHETSVDRDRYSRKDSESGRRTEKN